MACAEDVEQRHGQHRLDEDFERAAADQAGVVLGVLVEIEGEGAGLFLAMTSRAACQTSASTQPPPMVPAMEPSSRMSILALWNEGMEPRDVDDGGHGAAAALALQLHDLLVDIHLLRLLERVHRKSIGGEHGNREQGDKGARRRAAANCFSGCLPPHWGFQVKLLAFKGLTIEYLF